MEVIRGLRIQLDQVVVERNSMIGEWDVVIVERYVAIPERDVMVCWADMAIHES